MTLEDQIAALLLLGVGIVPVAAAVVDASTWGAAPTIGLAMVGSAIAMVVSAGRARPTKAMALPYATVVKRQ